jgi:hypothetical protein
MLTVSIIFFTLAALLGLTMAYLFFSGKPVPLFIPAAHGLLAVTGLLLLLIAWSQLQIGLLTPIIFFVLAATGGIYLVSFHLRNQRPPSGIIIVHGLVAATAFILLLLAAGRATG